MAPRVTTRIGLARDAIEVTDELDLVELVRGHRDRGAQLDYLICDEACFYTVDQVEQLADLVDQHNVDVLAFGLATDFRAELFPATRRFFERYDLLVTPALAVPRFELARCLSEPRTASPGREISRFPVRAMVSF